MKMDRFVSNTTNRVDSKGRVSIPANFRTILAGQQTLHVLLNIERSVADAGGSDFIDENLNILSQMDPLSHEYETWSFCLLGDADELKIDPEGRIVLSDNIKAHTGISDHVTFVGRGHFFQLWQPQAYLEYRQQMRSSALEQRRSGSLRQLTGKQNSPVSQAGTVSSHSVPEVRSKKQED